MFPLRYLPERFQNGEFSMSDLQDVADRQVLKDSQPSGSEPDVPAPQEPANPPTPRQRAIVAALLAIIALFLVASPWPLSNKLHAIGRACCAQIRSHTLVLGGHPMPLDSRNTGIYLGVLLVLALLWLTGREKAALFTPPSVRNLLLGLVAAMIVDGFNSMQQSEHLRGLYVDSNALRVITGVLSGMALTILVIPVFNRIVWRHPDPIAIADDFTDLAGYLGAALVVILMLLRAPAMLYWPLSLASILGLLITLTMVNSAIVLVGLRHERSLQTRSDLIVPLLAGLTCTCIEITLIDLWRIAAHR
jgi:uncharacterized membrane protein